VEGSEVEKKRLKKARFGEFYSDDA